MDTLVPTMAEIISAGAPIATAFGGLVLLVAGFAIGKFGINYVSGKLKKVAR